MQLDRLAASVDHPNKPRRIRHHEEESLPPGPQGIAEHLPHRQIEAGPNRTVRPLNLVPSHIEHGALLTLNIKPEETHIGQTKIHSHVMVVAGQLDRPSGRDRLDGGQSALVLHAEDAVAAGAL